MSPGMATTRDQVTARAPFIAREGTCGMIRDGRSPPQFGPLPSRRIPPDDALADRDRAMPRERLELLTDAFDRALASDRVAEAEVHRGAALARVRRPDRRRDRAADAGSARRGEGRRRRSRSEPGEAIARARDAGRMDLLARGWLADLGGVRLNAGATSPAPASRWRRATRSRRPRSRGRLGDRTGNAPARPGPDRAGRARRGGRHAGPRGDVPRPAAVRSTRTSSRRCAASGPRRCRRRAKATRRVAVGAGGTPAGGGHRRGPSRSRHPRSERRSSTRRWPSSRALVGLANVKAEVDRLVDLLAVQGRRKAAGKSVPEVGLHLVFVGPPGTGKTTVARLIGRIYRGLGVLRSGHLIETDRAGLVAGYIGQTASRSTRSSGRRSTGCCSSTRPTRSRPGATRTSAQEAIAALLKRMEDERERLAAVLAGYDQPMQRMLDSNPGLRSRFPTILQFVAYTAEELAEIFRRMMGKYDYALSPAARRAPARGLRPDDRRRRGRTSATPARCATSSRTRWPPTRNGPPTTESVDLSTLEPQDLVWPPPGQPRGRGDGGATRRRATAACAGGLVATASGSDRRRRAVESNRPPWTAVTPDSRRSADVRTNSRHPAVRHGKGRLARRRTISAMPPDAHTLAERLRRDYESFSPAQQALARYLVDHIAELPLLSAHEVAHAAHCSPATVVRFAQALGYAGYPELQRTVRAAQRPGAAAAARGPARPVRGWRRARARVRRRPPGPRRRVVTPGSRRHRAARGDAGRPQPAGARR